LVEHLRNAALQGAQCASRRLPMTGNIPRRPGGIRRLAANFEYDALLSALRPPSGAK
jgi:hypothetical protein